MMRFINLVAVLVVGFGCSARIGFEAADTESDGVGEHASGVQLALPPTLQLASIIVVPPAAVVGTDFVLDVRFVVDEPLDGWTVRWDWTGDGEWNTPWLPVVGIQHRYEHAGSYLILAELAAEDGRRRILSASTWVTGADESPLVVDVAGGLTLRDAILQGNATAGEVIIVLSGPQTITLNEPLPDLNGSSPTTLVGDGQVIIDGGEVEDCLTLTTGGHRIVGLVFRGCQTAALRIFGESSEVFNSRFENNYTGLVVHGAGTTVGPGNVFVGHIELALGIEAVADIHDNRFSNNTKVAVMMSQASGSLFVGNVVDKNGSGVTLGGNTNDVVMAHNTFVGNQGDALMLPAAISGLDFRNNIVAWHPGFGIHAHQDNFAAFDFNLYFANLAGNCRFCTSLGVNSHGANPRFIDANAGNYALTTESPCIDNGAPLGFNRNGDAAGSHNGAAPDIGAIEL